MPTCFAMFFLIAANCSVYFALRVSRRCLGTAQACAESWQNTQRGLRDPDPTVTPGTAVNFTSILQKKKSLTNPATVLEGRLAQGLVEIVSCWWIPV